MDRTQWKRAVARQWGKYNIVEPPENVPLPPQNVGMAPGGSSSSSAEPAPSPPQPRDYLSRDDYLDITTLVDIEFFNEDPGRFLAAFGWAYRGMTPADLPEQAFLDLQA